MSRLYCPRAHPVEAESANEYWCDSCRMSYSADQVAELAALRCRAPGCTRPLDVLKLPEFTILTCGLHPNLSVKIRN